MSGKLEQLEEMLTGKNREGRKAPQKDTGVNLHRMEAENSNLARDVQKRLLKLHTILQDSRFRGYLQLGTDSTKIDWAHMPADVAAFFKPEFSYQPGEITGFHIRLQDDRSSNGKVVLDMTLDRRDMWYSTVYAGSIVRKDYISGGVHATCTSHNGQIQEARLAGEAMQEKFGGRLKDNSNERIARIAVSIDELKLTDRLVEFAAGVAQKQISPKKVK